MMMLLMLMTMHIGVDFVHDDGVNDVDGFDDGDDGDDDVDDNIESQ